GRGTRRGGRKVNSRARRRASGRRGLSLPFAGALWRGTCRRDPAGEPRLNVARASLAQEIRVPAPAVPEPISGEQPTLPHGVLPAELEFYRSYDWCLNPHPTVREAGLRLRAGIRRLAPGPQGRAVRARTTQPLLPS